MMSSLNQISRAYRKDICIHTYNRTKNEFFHFIKNGTITKTDFKRQITSKPEYW